MTRPARRGVVPRFVQLGSGSSQHALQTPPAGRRTPRTRKTPPNATPAQNGPSQRVQRLVLEDFPDPKLARALSPNGRVHWASRKRARELVEWIVANAIFDQHLHDGMAYGPVRITYRWICPDRRKRDLDNHSTGVVKVVQDSLVASGLLVADDTSVVTSIAVEVSVERGRRALVIDVEACDPAAMSGD